MSAAASQYRHFPRCGLVSRLRTTHDIDFHAAPDDLRHGDITQLGDAAESAKKGFGQLNLSAGHEYNLMSA